MSQGTTRTAYVICQGEVVICQQPNRPVRIYLLAPEVPGHIYKAGAYLEEREVQPHTPLTLEVVGASAFKPPENVLTFGKTGTPLVDRARLVVDLPVSLNIHSGVKEDLKIRMSKLWWRTRR